MTNRMSVGEHLRNVNTIVGQLANMGIVVPYEELLDLVFKSLLASWFIFRQMITNRENFVYFAKLENLMIQEDGLRTRALELEGSEEPMFASRYNQRSSRSPFGRFFSDWRCSNFCGRGSFPQGFGNNLNHGGASGSRSNFVPHSSPLFKWLRKKKFQYSSN
jgi:hypothetical protein